MSDTIFRTKTEPSQVQEVNLPISKSPGITGIKDNIDVPYSDYTQTHGHPHSVDFYNLGDLWEEGYSSEVSAIEDYLGKLIAKGDIANTIKSVDNKLKELEKINNLKNEDRTVVKIGTIASYIKFLQDTEQIKYNSFKYGN